MSQRPDTPSPSEVDRILGGGPPVVDWAGIEGELREQVQQGTSKGVAQEADFGTFTGTVPAFCSVCVTGDDSTVVADGLQMNYGDEHLFVVIGENVRAQGEYPPCWHVAADHGYFDSVSHLFAKPGTVPYPQPPCVVLLDGCPWANGRINTARLSPCLSGLRPVLLVVCDGRLLSNMAAASGLAVAKFGRYSTCWRCLGTGRQGPDEYCVCDAGDYRESGDEVDRIRQDRGSFDLSEERWTGLEEEGALESADLPGPSGPPSAGSDDDDDDDDGDGGVVYDFGDYYLGSSGDSGAMGSFQVMAARIADIPCEPDGMYPVCVWCGTTEWCTCYELGMPVKEAVTRKPDPAGLPRAAVEPGASEPGSGETTDGLHGLSRAVGILQPLGFDGDDVIRPETGLGGLFGAYALPTERPHIIFPLPVKVGLQYHPGAMWVDLTDVGSLVVSLLCRGTAGYEAYTAQPTRVFTNAHLYSPAEWKRVPALVRNAVNGGSTPAPVPAFPRLGMPWQCGCLGEHFSVFAALHTGGSTVRSDTVGPLVLEPISGAVYAPRPSDEDLGVPALFLPPVHTWSQVNDLEFGRLAMEWRRRHL